MWVVGRQRNQLHWAIELGVEWQRFHMDNRYIRYSQLSFFQVL